MSPNQFVEMGQPCRSTANRVLKRWEPGIVENNYFITPVTK